MAIKTSVNISIGELTLAFPTMGTVTLHGERIHQTLRDTAMWRSLTAKVVDTMAIEREKFPDGIVPESVKFDRASEMVKWLESGTDQWNPGRAASGTSDKTLLNAAWLELMGAPIAAEKLKAMTARQVDAMLVHKDIKPIADRLRAEAVASVDTEALFAELME